LFGADSTVAKLGIFAGVVTSAVLHLCCSERSWLLGRIAARRDTGNAYQMAQMGVRGCLRHVLFFFFLKDFKDVLQ